MVKERNSKQCMVEKWNLTNQRGSEHNLCSPKFMQIALQERDLLLWHIQVGSQIHRKHCDRRLQSPRSFYLTGLVCVPDDCCKKVMDVIARLPGCDGQAADAVTPHIQVKMEDAPRLLRIPKSECPDIWSTTWKAKNHGKTLQIQWFFFIEMCTGHPLAGRLWVKFSWNLKWK